MLLAFAIAKQLYSVCVCLFACFHLLCNIPNWFLFQFSLFHFILRFCQFTFVVAISNSLFFSFRVVCFSSSSSSSSFELDLKWGEQMVKKCIRNAFTSYLLSSFSVPILFSQIAKAVVVVVGDGDPRHSHSPHKLSEPTGTSARRKIEKEWKCESNTSIVLHSSFFCSLGWWTI